MCRASAVRIRWAASAMISGWRERRSVASPPSRLATAAVAMAVRGQSALTAMPRRLNSSARPEHAEAHAVLGHGVGEVLGEPLGVEVERRREVQDVRVGRASQVGDGGLRAEEGAARVDRCMRSKRSVGVAQVPARKMALALLTRTSTRRRSATVRRPRAGPAPRRGCRHERQGLAARRLDFCGGGVDGAGELGVGVSVLAATAMLAPSRAARRAITRPMPRLPPVMNRVLPFRSATAASSLILRLGFVQPCGETGREFEVVRRFRHRRASGGRDRPRGDRCRLHGAVHASDDVGCPVGES